MKIFILIFFTSILYLLANSSDTVIYLDFGKVLNIIESQNISIINKREYLKYTLFEIDEAKSAARPNLKFQSDISKLKSYQMKEASNVYSYKINLYQPLFTYGKINTAIEIAKHYYKNSELDYKNTIRETQLQAIIYLYTLQYLEEKLKLLENSEKSLYEHLIMVKNKFSAETVTELEYKTAEVAYHQIKPQILAIKNEIENLKNDLRLLLNLDIKKEIVITEEIKIPSQIPDFNNQDFIIEQIKKNENIKKLYENLEIIKLQKKIAKNSLRPELNLISNYGSGGNTFSNSFNNSDYFYGVELNFPLFDGYKSSNEVKKFDIEIENLNREINYLTMKIINEINKENNNIKFYNEQIKVNTLLKEQSEEAYRIAKENYSAGAAINTDVLDAEQNRLNANFLLLESKYNILISINKLKYLLSLNFLE
ncbi:MAG TPA: TolC family protein [bacterium]|nr:TolC family protein [bacterium]HOL48006.1 TolC family protein [bacterium]HPQ19308.1 TolC family protein [bacterium]